MPVPYLAAHPPRRRQYRSPRRARPSGVTVLHTAESITDLVGVDTGAEAVATFIRGRAEPGSYHDLVDRDSALQLVPYDAEAYQDGTGTNPHALSISWAISCRDWPKFTKRQTVDLLEQGAVAFLRQQEWLAAHGYPQTPLRRITGVQAGARVPGFVKHGDRDPGRRSDPGDHFPWALWLEVCRNALHPPTVPTPTGDQPMRLYKVRPDREGQPWLRLALMADGRLLPFDSNDGADALVAAGIPEQELTRPQYDGLRRGLGELLS